MNCYILHRYLVISLMILLFTGSVSAAEKEKMTVPKSATCVLKYDMEEGSGYRLKDGSSFYNDAVAIGHKEYGKIFNLKPRDARGRSLQIGNPGGIKTCQNGAFIAHSESLQPEEFIIDIDIKPTAEQQKFCKIFRAHVTPFYYNKPRIAGTSSYFPLEIDIWNDNRMRLNLSLEKGEAVKYKNFQSPSPLPLNKFTSVRWILKENELRLYFDGKEQKKWAVTGKVLYDHPDYYPGHVSFQFGTGDFEGELDNFAIYDLKINEKKNKEGIKISTDKDFNFFATGEKKEFTVGIENFTDEEKNGILAFTSTDHNNKNIYSREMPVSLKPLQNNQFKIEVPSKLRGCFWLKCEFKGKDGKVFAEREESYAVGAIRDVGSIPDSSPFGIHTAEPVGFSWSNPDLGTKWVRLNLSRWVLEPEEGKYRWELSDAPVNYHNKNGRKIMACLWGMPAWAADKSKEDLKSGKFGANYFWNHQPKDWKKHEKFLRKLIARYKDQVDVWEVWNEANCGYWKGEVSEYMKLLKLTHKIVRELDPDAKIAGPSSFNSGWDAWSGEILQEGAANYMDIWLVHYLGGGYGRTPNPEGAAQKIADTREMLKTSGKVLQIWDGETGYLTATRRGKDLRPISPEELNTCKKTKEIFLNDNWAPSPKSANNTKCLDEITSSNLYVRRVAVCLANGVNRFFHHTMGSWRYEADIQRNRFWKGTGILLPSIAISNMSEKLANAEFLRKINLGNGKLYGYLFRNRDNDENIVILWCSKGYEDVVLINKNDSNGDGISGNIKVSDIWGNPIEELPVDTKRIRLHLTESPIYLEGIDKNINNGESFFSIKGEGLLVKGDKAKLLFTCYNPTKEKLSAKIVFKGPEGFRFSPERFSVSLNPGEKSNHETVALSPIQCDKDTAIIEAFFEVKDKQLTESRTVFLKMIPPPFPCVKRKVKINIDGKMDADEWAKIVPALLEEEEQVVIGRPHNYGDKITIVKEKEWYGPDDLSAKAWLCADDKNLYLMVKVKDNSICVNQRDTASAYLGDSLEIFIDGRPKKDQTNPMHTSGVYHLLLIPGDKDHPEASWTWCGESAGKKKSLAIELKSEQTNDGYLIEAKIPLNKKIFPELDLTEGRVLGFDLCINDADHGKTRKSQMSWRGTKNNYVDAANFGKLIITSKKNQKEKKYSTGVKTDVVAKTVPPAKLIHEDNLDRGLAASWKLDGNLKDSVGKNNGEGINITFSNEGNTRFAVFNGKDSYVKIKPDTSFVKDKQISISAWVKGEFTGKSGCIIGISGYRNGWRMIVFDTKKYKNVPAIQIGANSGAKGASAYNHLLKIGKWFHLVAVWDGVWVRLYCNGKMVKGSHYSGEYIKPPSWDFLGIGYGGAKGIGYFNGYIRDVRIWNRGISKSEIKKLYNFGNILN